MLIAAATLAGCSVPQTRDSAAQRPEMANEATVSRSGPGSFAGAGGSAPSCVQGSHSASPGTTMCQAKQSYRCVNGIWEKTAAAC